MTFAHSSPFVIIGAGHFGARAAKILTGEEFRGYRLEDLGRLSAAVRTKKTERWLVGTACKCHGMLTAFRVRNLAQDSLDSRSETEMETRSSADGRSR